MFRRFWMKKFLVIVALLAFAGAVPMAMAAEKKAKEVNCCVKGKVEKLSKADCKKAKGKVVKSAKQCKPAK
jgi:hypothetical protein